MSYTLNIIIVLCFIILIISSTFNKKKVTKINKIINNDPKCPANSFYCQCTNYMWNNLPPLVSLYSKSNPKIWVPNNCKGSEHPEFIINNNTKTPRINIYNSNIKATDLFPQYQIS